MEDPEVASQYPVLTPDNIKILSAYSNEELIDICLLTLSIMRIHIKKREELIKPIDEIFTHGFSRLIALPKIC